jgi:cytidine deaminase
VPVQARRGEVWQESGRPADYFFNEKVTEPCGADREVLEEVTREEVVNMIMIVKGQVEESKHFIVSIYLNTDILVCYLLYFIDFFSSFLVH